MPTGLGLTYAAVQQEAARRRAEQEAARARQFVPAMQPDAVEAQPVFRPVGGGAMKPDVVNISYAWPGPGWDDMVGQKHPKMVVLPEAREFDSEGAPSPYGYSPPDAGRFVSTGPTFGPEPAPLPYTGSGMTGGYAQDIGTGGRGSARVIQIPDPNATAPAEPPSAPVFRPVRGVPLGTQNPFDPLPEETSAPVVQVQQAAPAPSAPAYTPVPESALSKMDDYMAQEDRLVGNPQKANINFRRTNAVAFLNEQAEKGLALEKSIAEQQAIVKALDHPNADFGERESALKKLDALTKQRDADLAFFNRAVEAEHAARFAEDEHGHPMGGISLSNANLSADAMDPKAQAIREMNDAYNGIVIANNAGNPERIAAATNQYHAAADRVNRLYGQGEGVGALAQKPVDPRVALAQAQDAQAQARRVESYNRSVTSAAQMLAERGHPADKALWFVDEDDKGDFRINQEALQKYLLLPDAEKQQFEALQERRAKLTSAMSHLKADPMTGWFGDKSEAPAGVQTEIDKMVAELGMLNDQIALFTANPVDRAVQDRIADAMRKKAAQAGAR